MDSDSAHSSGATRPKQSVVSAKSSLGSNSHNLHIQPLSRLGSLRTQTSTNTSSKNTAFYSAHSNFADTSTNASFHTADTSANAPFHTADAAATSTNEPPFHIAETDEMPQQRSTGWTAKGQHEREEDENLVHSMARQYVLDAEALGPSTPDKSRRNTDASRGIGGDIVTTTSEDMMPVPQLPMMEMVGRDYDSQLAQSNSVSEKSSSSHEQRALSERLRDEEVEDDAFEAQHFVSTRMRYPPPKYSVRADASIPAGAVLFACGFLVLPLWWVGAVFPRNAHDDVVRTWRKYNALMTLLSLPLLGLFLALGGWQATHN